MSIDQLFPDPHPVIPVQTTPECRKQLCIETCVEFQ